VKIFRPFSPVLLVFIFCAVVEGGEFRCFNGDNQKPTIIKTPTDGGIRENIPEKYKERFAKWKEELLATEFGREQWETYAGNKKFILTIVMSEKRGQGAGTDKYLWDEEGSFVGATITLGTKIDKGYPDPIYYPVMNSLSSNENKFSISGNLLAATKIVHEIGHVNQTARANRETLALQNRLMPQYISIFLKNGRNPSDKELLEIAEKMGGTPVKIWENREYWSEVTAMSFLKERISKENFYCQVFNKIRYNIEQYAKDYEERFEEVAPLPGASCRK
jgi:hypothetical protein